MSETRDVATKFAAESGGSFRVTHDMADAFEGADIVCPKSWAPFAAMEERTELYGNGDTDGIKALEKRLLAQNAEFTDWTTTEELMASTKDGKGLYMHPLPADITGLSCKQGEVDESVFSRYRVPMYAEASNKPYSIAAMIFLQKVKDPIAKLNDLLADAAPRWRQ